MIGIISDVTCTRRMRSHIGLRRRCRAAKRANTIAHSAVVTTRLEADDRLATATDAAIMIVSHTALYADMAGEIATLLSRRRQPNQSAVVRTRACMSSRRSLSPPWNALASCSIAAAATAVSAVRAEKRGTRPLAP